MRHPPIHEHMSNIPVDSENKPKKVMFGPYIVGPTIGRGEFGKVKMGWTSVPKGSNAVPKQVAIKFIRRDSILKGSDRETKMFREINALRHLTHPNIVKLQDVLQNSKYIGIVLVYVAGGEFYKYIQKRRRLRESEACKIFAQLISGVGYMHGKGLVHRDLKLENLLLDNHLNLVITDFGFVNEFTKSGSLMKTSCGSPCYAAPELVVGTEGYVGTKADIWSCGIILFAMLAGYLPWDDDPENPGGDDIARLYDYILSTPLKFPEYVTLRPRDLLRRILVPDPERRLDMRGIKAHQWLSLHADFLSITVEQWDTVVRERKSYRRPHINSYHPSTDTALPTYGKITDAGRRLVNSNVLVNRRLHGSIDSDSIGIRPMEQDTIGSKAEINEPCQYFFNEEMRTSTPLSPGEDYILDETLDSRDLNNHYCNERPTQHQYQNIIKGEQRLTLANIDSQKETAREASESIPSPPPRPLTVRNIVGNGESDTSPPKAVRTIQRTKIRPTSYHASMHTNKLDDVISLQTEILSGLTLGGQDHWRREIAGTHEATYRYNKRLSMPVDAAGSISSSSRVRRNGNADQQRLDTIDESYPGNTSGYDKNTSGEVVEGPTVAVSNSRHPSRYPTISGSSKGSSEPRHSNDRRKRYSTPISLTSHLESDLMSSAHEHGIKKYSSPHITNGLKTTTAEKSHVSTIPKSVTLDNTSAACCTQQQGTILPPHRVHSRSRSASLKRTTAVVDSSSAEVAAVRASAHARARTASIGGDEGVAHTETRTGTRRGNSTARKLLDFFKYGSMKL